MKFNLKQIDHTLKTFLADLSDLVSDSHVESLKLVLQDILFICDQEDDADKMHFLCHANTLHHLGNFIKPTTKLVEIFQKVVVCNTPEVRERSKYIMRLALESIKISIDSVHSTIMDYQFSEEQRNSTINNVFAERCFGQLDAVSRLHRNLKFVHKETTVMAAQNKFWPWFKERDQHKMFNFK